MNAHENAARTMTPLAWKDGEVRYCLELVRTEGNTNVPRRLVAEYLMLQSRDVDRRMKEAGEPTYRNGPTPMLRLSWTLFNASERVEEGQWRQAALHIADFVERMEEENNG